MSIGTVIAGIFIAVVLVVVYDLFFNDTYKHDLPDLRDVDPNEWREKE